MKRRWLTMALVLFVALARPFPSVRVAHSAPPAQVPDPGPDAYEPDDPGSGDPPWIGEGEAQERNFYPEGDVDRARLYVKAGHWYEVQTAELGSLVDTVLHVEVGDAVYVDDDGGREPLSSRVVFQAPATLEATITISNAQGVYGPQQSYRLHAAEMAAPTPTPTATPPPTATARPTSPPAPTATPPKPVINFSATPQRLEAPGECATLRWAVDRASEVFLVLPNGNQEGVEGLGERQVCPTQTSEYLLKVNAPGGSETVRVQVAVPQPTPTPTPVQAASVPGSGVPGTGGGGKATLHVTVYVDNNNNSLPDAGEGIEGAAVRIVCQADPGQVRAGWTDAEGQVHFPRTAAGSYAILIPHLGHAQAISFRGEETALGIAFPALRLPSRIP